VLSIILLIPLPKAKQSASPDQKERGARLFYFPCPVSPTVRTEGKGKEGGYGGFLLTHCLVGRWKREEGRKRGRRGEGPTEPALIYSSIYTIFLVKCGTPR